MNAPKQTRRQISQQLLAVEAELVDAAAAVNAKIDRLNMLVGKYNGLVRLANTFRAHAHKRLLAIDPHSELVKAWERLDFYEIDDVPCCELPPLTDAADLTALPGADDDA